MGDKWHHTLVDFIFFDNSLWFHFNFCFQCSNPTYYFCIVWNPWGVLGKLGEKKMKWSMVKKHRKNVWDFLCSTNRGRWGNSFKMVNLVLANLKEYRNENMNTLLDRVKKHMNWAIWISCFFLSLFFLRWAIGLKLMSMEYIHSLSKKKMIKEGEENSKCYLIVFWTQNCSEYVKVLKPSDMNFMAWMDGTEE